MGSCHRDLDLFLCKAAAFLTILPGYSASSVVLLGWESGMEALGIRRSPTRREGETVRKRRTWSYLALISGSPSSFLGFVHGSYGTSLSLRRNCGAATTGYMHASAPCTADRGKSRCSPWFAVSQDASAPRIRVPLAYYLHRWVQVLCSLLLEHLEHLLALES